MNLTTKTNAEMTEQERAEREARRAAIREQIINDQATGTKRVKNSIYTVKMSLGSGMSTELKVEAANKNQAIDKAHDRYGLTSRKNFSVVSKMSMKDYYGFKVK